MGIGTSSYLIWGYRLSIHFDKYEEKFRILFIVLIIIEKITEKEYDGDLDTYENKVKLYKRLDKELEGTDRVFLKILKNDIKELEPIDDYTKYLTDQMAEYDGEAEQKYYSDYDEENIGCQSADDDGNELHF